MINYNPLKVDYNPDILYINIIQKNRLKSNIMEFFDKLIMKTINYWWLSYFLFSALATYYVSYYVS